MDLPGSTSSKIFGHETLQSCVKILLLSSKIHPSKWSAVHPKKCTIAQHFSRILAGIFLHNSVDVKKLTIPCCHD